MLKIRKLSVRHIYKKLESESIVKVDTIKQDIEEDKLGRDNIDNGEVNPYHEIITNKIDMEKIVTSQIQNNHQYSIT